jgi:hypothetical protein
VTASSSVPHVYPKLVTRTVRSLELELNRPVNVTQPDPLSWRVSLDTGHVQLVIDFKARLGKTRFASSTLTVNGKPHRLARGPQDLRQIIQKTEVTSHVKRPVTAEPVPLNGSLEEAPTTVVSLCKSLALKLQDVDGVTLRAGRDQHRWVIGVDSSRSELRVFFTRQRRQWGLDGRRPLQVIIDGKDRSAEASGDLSKAMLMLSYSEPSEPPSGAVSSVVGHTSARSNSVETRRATVIRN